MIDVSSFDIGLPRYKQLNDAHEVLGCGEVERCPLSVGVFVHFCTAV